jgi:hypothetical protein
MKTIKPNTVLPKGAKLLNKPVRKQTGNWVSMVFDAKLVRKGITWLRVKDGMSGNNDREDWVADIPKICASAHDYEWREPRFGAYKYNSFKEALDGAVALAIDYTDESIQNREEALIATKASMAKLRKAYS